MDSHAASHVGYYKRKVSMDSHAALYCIQLWHAYLIRFISFIHTVGIRSQFRLCI